MQLATLDDPHKIFYSIGEVSSLTGLKSHILRYWESEFPTLRPEKRSNGRRAYRKSDILLVIAIKKLLYEEGYTIAGARKKISEARKKPEPNAGNVDVVAELREDLEELRELLKDGLKRRERR
jgi:DNA-binding transcriptional MerR regulator